MDIEVKPLKPKWGERAAKIRKMKVRYPELTDSEIARSVGCDPSNVTQVLKVFLGKNSEHNLREFQQHTADVYDATKMRFLQSVTEEKLAKTSAVSAVVAVGILHDKAALIRGQATGIDVHVIMDMANMIREKRDQNR